MSARARDSRSLSLSLFLSHTHKHTHLHTHMNIHTHTHTHTPTHTHTLSLSLSLSLSHTHTPQDANQGISYCSWCANVTHEVACSFALFFSDVCVSSLAVSGTENVSHNTKVKEASVTKRGVWEMHPQVYILACLHIYFNIVSYLLSFRVGGRILQFRELCRQLNCFHYPALTP